MTDFRPHKATLDALARLLPSSAPGWNYREAHAALDLWSPNYVRLSLRALAADGRAHSRLATNKVGNPSRRYWRAHSQEAAMSVPGRKHRFDPQVLDKDEQGDTANDYRTKAHEQDDAFCARMRELGAKEGVSVNDEARVIKPMRAATFMPSASSLATLA